MQIMPMGDKCPYACGQHPMVVSDPYGLICVPCLCYYESLTLHEILVKEI